MTLKKIPTPKAAHAALIKITKAEMLKSGLEGYSGAEAVLSRPKVFMAAKLCEVSYANAKGHAVLVSDLKAAGLLK